MNFSGHKILTYICYDALFPKFSTNMASIVIVQSNYNQLKKGYGFDNIIKYGSILGWFSSALNSDFYINVQDTGGTIVIRKNHGLDNDIYQKSKQNPFLVVETNT